MKNFFAALGLLLLLLLAVLLVRAFTARSRQVAVSQVTLVPVDAQRASARLAKAVQIKTVSEEDAPPDHPAFQQLQAFLAQAYPNVTAHLTREVVNQDSLLYTWKGTDSSLAPVVLMGHMDVVPVEQSAESAWTHPPYSGDIAEGFIWGRGTLDDKVGVLGALEAAEALLQQNFQPRRTFYFSFGADEELTGFHGAKQLSTLLAARGIKPALVMDEGGYIVHNLVPGHAGPVAFINIAEKGYLTVAVRAQGAGGHSAVASKQNAIDSVSRALSRLQKHPFQTRLPDATAATVDALAPEMPFGLRLAMANRWLFGPVIVQQYARDPDTEALVRTTMAPTVFRSGIKENVVPRTAEALVNLRLLPGDSLDATLARLRKVIKDPSITVEPKGDAYPAPPVADFNTLEFAAIARSIREVSPATLVVPGLMSGTSDARFYGALTPNVVRYLPIELGPEDVARIHGINERISVDNYQRAIQFDAQLIRNLGQ
jgi:carboxypeptidase PM20D1